MSRVFYQSGMAFLFCALVLSFLASISLPYLPALDFVRANFGKSVIRGEETLSEIRWGIWGPCLYDQNEKRFCDHTGHGYAVGLEAPDGTIEIIGASWTRGLAIHPVATGVIAIAFGFAVSRYEHGQLIASLTSFLSAVILLIAFAIDIALYADVHHQVGKLPDVRGNVNAGAAFWMTMVSFILVLLAGCTVCFGRRRESGITQSYPMMSKPSGGFFARFRR